MTGALVIGHRGASGHRPEHTSMAYRLAWRSGADSVEPDVVSTRDGVLVCRHDLDLNRTTDVAQHAEFAHRRRRLVIDKVVQNGWFVQDFDLSELRRLRARERWPGRRPVSAMYDGQGHVLTLEELLDLRETESARAGRELGVHIELKHPGLFEGLGMPVHEPLVELLRRRHLTTALSPVAVMSFDTSVLHRLRRSVETELVRLIGRQEPIKRRRLHEMARCATSIGVHKSHAVDRTVRLASRSGLGVLVWTLRKETPEDVARILDLGVDGVLTDFPAATVAVRDRWVARATGSAAS